jgi:hypothetical protein
MLVEVVEDTQVEHHFLAEVLAVVEEVPQVFVRAHHLMLLLERQIVEVVVAEAPMRVMVPSILGQMVDRVKSFSEYLIMLHCHAVVLDLLQNISVPDTKYMYGMALATLHLVKERINGTLC